MRLTNPEDQSYVKRLVPDTLGNLIDELPAMEVGEGIIIGDSIIIPSIVKIDVPEKEPSSSDIPYYELWQEKWKDIDIENIKNEWYS
jgi:hypothetical protein